MKLSTAAEIMCRVIFSGVSPVGVSGTDEQSSAMGAHMANMAAMAARRESLNKSSAGMVAAATDSETSADPTNNEEQTLMQSLGSIEEEVRDYEMDYAITAFPLHRRIMHFLGEDSLINEVNRKAVEYALIIEAGSSVSEEETTDNAQKESLMLAKYLSIIDDLPNDIFFNTNIKAIMRSKLYMARVDNPMTGKSLYRKFVDIRRDIRREYWNNLPTGIATLASGNQLRDAYNSFIVHKFKKERPNECDGQEDEDILQDVVPKNFWLSNKSCHALLAVMVHRHNKEIAPECKDLPAGPTRVEQRAAAKGRTEENRARAHAEDDHEVTVKKCRLSVSQTAYWLYGAMCFTKVAYDEAYDVSSALTVSGAADGARLIPGVFQLSFKSDLDEDRAHMYNVIERIDTLSPRQKEALYGFLLMAPDPVFDDDDDDIAFEDDDEMETVDFSTTK